MSNITLGTAPDSWGVWFADDEKQPSFSQFLDEASAAGFEWIELGAWGYLPTNPQILSSELEQRGLRVAGATAFAGLQRSDSYEDVWESVKPIAALLADLGGKDLVVIPDLWRDDATGVEKLYRHLSNVEWDRLCDGHNRLGKQLLEEFDVRLQFHPHADSHVGFQHDIERFMDSTDPEYVNFCLDTGHVAYHGGDNLALISKYASRIGYVHLKSVDPEIARNAIEGDLWFSRAVELGVIQEAPAGSPDLPEILRALEQIGRPLFAISEHDLYPVAFDVPLPIARRTHAYLSSQLS